MTDTTDTDTRTEAEQQLYRIACGNGGLMMGLAEHVAHLEHSILQAARNTTHENRAGTVASNMHYLAESIGKASRDLTDLAAAVAALEDSEA